MHKDHDNFVEAICATKKIRLIFFDNDKHLTAKTVVPLDYVPGQRATDLSSCYQFWDFEVGAHGTPLMLQPEQIQSMEVDKETFNPEDFVNAFAYERKGWRHFFIQRNWGLDK